MHERNFEYSIIWFPVDEQGTSLRSQNFEDESKMFCCKGEQFVLVKVKYKRSDLHL